MSFMHIHDRGPSGTAQSSHGVLAPGTLDSSIKPRRSGSRRSRRLAFAGGANIRVDMMAVALSMLAKLLGHCHRFVELTGQVMPEFAFAADDEEFGDGFGFQAFLDWAFAWVEGCGDGSGGSVECWRGECCALSAWGARHESQVWWAHGGG